MGSFTNQAPAKATPKPRDPDVALEALILSTLEDDKAEEIMEIDLRGKSSIADTMIIASGRSARHVSAISDHVLQAIKDQGYARANVEGAGNADWVLIDAGDVIVHLFRPEVRDFYQLERIWGAREPEETKTDTASPAPFDP